MTAGVALVEPHASFTLISRHSHDNQVGALEPIAVDVRSLRRAAYLAASSE